MHFKPFSSLIIRSPQLPFDNLNNLLTDRRNAIGLFEQDFIKEAIYIASPVLFQQLMKLSRGEIVDRNKKERIENSFIRYLIRMSTKCTPFGLFSCCLTAQIKSESSFVEIVEPPAFSTRLDTSLLYSLYDKLIQQREIKEELFFYPNPTIYRIGNYFRYVEPMDFKNGTSKISQIPYSSTLWKLLQKARRGMNPKELIQELLNERYEEEDCIDYVKDLITNKILIDDLYYPTIGGDYLDRINRKLQNIFSIEAETAKSIFKLTRNIDIECSSRRLEIFQEVQRKLKKINIEDESRANFKVDLFKMTSHSSINIKLVEELQAVLGFLNKLVPRINNERLSLFKKHFIERYEQQEVNIMEVLDLDVGIGYPVNLGASYIPELIADIKPLNIHSTQNNYFLSIIQKKLNQNREKILEIVLSDSDVHGIKENWADFPDTMAAFFQIINDNEREKLILFNGLLGCSAANLIGRFSHCDKSILNLIKEITETEQNSHEDKIVAEIVHLPEFRAGNILYRDHLRDYEIICSGHSDISNENKISVSDLTISIKNDRVILKSKRLNKIILPRLTTAHNYYNAKSPVYKLLCDLQNQDGCNGISVKKLVEINPSSPFVPRIKYKNTILLPAMWLMDMKTIKSIFILTERKEILLRFKLWKNKNLMPERVLLMNNDSNLFIDFSNDLCLESVISILKDETELVFTEFLFTEKESIVKSGQNSYLNEVILPFFK